MSCGKVLKMTNPNELYVKIGVGLMVGLDWFPGVGWRQSR